MTMTHGEGFDAERERRKIHDDVTRREGISSLQDQHGCDIQIVYSVALRFVVSAAAPCTYDQLAKLVRDRIQAHPGGIDADDIDSVEIIEVGIV
jgi:hypothetical protein